MRWLLLQRLASHLFLFSTTYFPFSLRRTHRQHCIHHPYVNLQPLAMLFSICTVKALLFATVALSSVQAGEVRSILSLDPKILAGGAALINVNVLADVLVSPLPPFLSPFHVHSADH